MRRLRCGISDGRRVPSGRFSHRLLGGNEMKEPPLAPWTVNKSSTVMKDRWIDLRADDCTTDSGVSVSPFYILHYPDWVHTMCLDEGDRICVVWQYRHGVARVTLELPGGIVEAGEDPLDAAKRELREEAGVHAQQWRACGSYATNPATHTNSVHIFACRLESLWQPQPDEAETVTHDFLSFEDIRREIDRGTFSNLMHVGALCRAMSLV